MHLRPASAGTQGSSRGGRAGTAPLALQAVDLRQGGDQLGAGTAALYRAVRGISPRLQGDRPLDQDIAALVAAMERRELPVVALDSAA